MSQRADFAGLMTGVDLGVRQDQAMSFLRTMQAAMLAAAVVAASTVARAETVNVHIDATAAVKPISRYIYGVNGVLGGQHANLTFRRVGGNRWTAYNWANNASNAGSDFIFQ